MITAGWGSCWHKVPGRKELGFEGQWGGESAVNARLVVKMRLVGEAWPDGAPLLRNEVQPQGNGSPRERRTLGTYISDSILAALWGRSRGRGQVWSSKSSWGAFVWICWTDWITSRKTLVLSLSRLGVGSGGEAGVHQPPAGSAIIKAMCR